MNCKAIIFDFDGTLMDTEEAIFHALRRTLDEFGIPIPAGTPLKQLSCHRMEDVMSSLGVEDTQKKTTFLEAYHKAYNRAFSESAKPFHGVRHVLSRLKNRGIRMAVATNEIRANLDRFLPLTEMGCFFETTICVDEVKQSKPHPEMALTVMERMGVPAANTMMVGDSFLDIQMGRAAKCRTCGISHGSHARKELAAHAPDWLVDNLAAIETII
ncbi:MAG: HAD family hydrolase [Desulfobacterales bacterium]|nr:HAD family hydrolase [Desulfobacterales bacterium]